MGRADETPWRLTSARSALVACAIAFAAPVSADVLIAPNDEQLTRNLLELPVIGGGDFRPQMAVSPDGRAVAFSVLTTNVEENTAHISWYVQELDGSRRTIPAGPGGDPLFNIRQRTPTSGATFGIDVRWSPDSQWFAYPKQVGDEIQLWRSRRDGSFQEQLTHNAANIFGSNRYEALFQWSADGTRIYFEVARPRADMVRSMAEEGRTGYLFDDRFLPSDSFQPLWGRCQQSRQSVAPVRSQACEPTLWTIDLRERSERLATLQELEEYQRLRGEVDEGNADGNQLERRLTEPADARQLLLRNADPATFRGYDPPLRLIARLHDGTETPCTSSQCVSQNIVNAWWVGDDVVFQRRGETGPRIPMRFFRWSPATGLVQQIVETNNVFDPCQASGTELVCFEEGITQPRRLVTLNAATSDVLPLYDPAALQAPNLLQYIQSIRAEYLSWTGEDGLQAVGVLLYPKDYRPGRSYPLVMIQGGVGSFPVTGAEDAPVFALLNSGFLVLNASQFENRDAYARYRGAELATVEFTNYQRRRRALASYEHIVSQLVERGLVDRDRVGVTGLSSNSANAKYAMVNSRIFATASLATGYSGPQSYWFSPSALRRQVRGAHPAYRRPYTSEAESIQDQEQLGYHAVDRLFPPVLHQVADSELSHALFDHVLLADEGHPVEMYVYPDELHVKWQPIHRYNIYRRNLDWFRFWLQGALSINPVDPLQYERWRSLCRRYIDNLRGSHESSDRARAETQRCGMQLD